jgi:hypothetical protein
MMAGNMEGLGTMLSFLQQGSDPGSDQTPAMQMPNVQMPALQQHQPGSNFIKGTLHSILGNLASQYVSNKLQKHMDKTDAEDTMKSYAPIVESLAKSSTNELDKQHYGVFSKLINSGDPNLVNQGISGIQNKIKQASELTSNQRDWADPEQHARMVAEDTYKNMPQIAREMSVMYPTLKPGSPEYAMQAMLLKRSGAMNINMGNPEAPLTQFEMEHLVDSKGNPVPQIPLGIKRGDAAKQGLAVGKVSSETEARTAASTVSSQDIADKIAKLRGQGHEISGLPGAIIDYRSGSSLLPAAINEGLHKLGYDITPQQTQLISYTKSLSNQLIQAMRGAQVGPQEQEAFEKSLPVAGQPQELFDQNLSTTIDNLGIINKRRASLRGLPNASTGESQSLPKIPPVGFIHKGYIFNGGDPSQKENWSKQ